MIVSIASGKGGTGKTSVAVNMALSIGNVQLLDCDVEEPNAHLLLNPKITQIKPVYVQVPFVNEKLCDHCGKCGSFCQYNAIFVSAEKVLIFPELCHSCGGCAFVCPKKAITEDKHKIGTLKIASAGDLRLVFGELEVGEPMAVPVIREVKRHIDNSKSVILDSPPGTSCPVIETVKGSDFCILVTEPTPFGMQEFKGSKLAIIDLAKCVKCGLCREKCRFNAITEDFKVDPFSCEGCGVCAIICPENAITLTERVSGHAYISKTKFGFMSHAMLTPSEANSGKLVTLVRRNSKIVAKKESINLIIIDGPPGIACPVIASVTGEDAGLVVAEPTMSGIHDLKRALQLLAHFNVLPFVCVNMYDINEDNAEEVESFCKENSVEVVGKIPFSLKLPRAMVNGKTIIEYSPRSAVTKEIEAIWEKISILISEK